MIKNFKNLKNNEVELLIKAPALFSVLVESQHFENSNSQNSDVIKLVHLKSFTYNDLSLLSYYTEVEKYFKIYFEAIVKTYFPFDDSKLEELRNEIENVNKIISKLDIEYADSLRRSLFNYGEHVKNTDRNVLDNFISPIPIDGISSY